MSIGKNLRKLRDGRNLSQQEVADFIGVERKTYMNWETDVSDVKDTYIPMLAAFFKVEIKDLFKDASVSNSNTSSLDDKEVVDEIVKIIQKRKIQKG